MKRSTHKDMETFTTMNTRGHTSYWRPWQNQSTHCNNIQLSLPVYYQVGSIAVSIQDGSVIGSSLMPYI